MAIQVRRGNYADLDTSKLVQGEPFVTLDNAPNGTPFVGMTIAPNNVVRLATYDELTDIKQDCEDARDEAVASAENAATSEENAGNSALDAEAWAVGERGGTPVTSGDDTYENNSKYYAELAETAWENVDEAVEFLTPQVTINFDTGELEYSGSQILFWIDQDTGFLMWNVVSA